MSRTEVLKSPFALINLMLADVPKMKKKKKEPEKFKDANELMAWFGDEN